MIATRFEVFEVYVFQVERESLHNSRFPIQKFILFKANVRFQLTYRIVYL